MSTRRGGDYVLEQERNAQEQIDIALKEKDDLLKRAKDAAKKDITVYEDQKREEFNRKITELNSNISYIEEIENKNKKEIGEIEGDYSRNREKVIDFLFENVLKVEIEIPDVVKGNFEEKFNVQETFMD